MRSTRGDRRATALARRLASRCGRPDEQARESASAQVPTGLRVVPGSTVGRADAIGMHAKSDPDRSARMPNLGNFRRYRGQWRYMEPDLRERVRAGDPDAFGMLFEGHSRAVYNLGFRLTANWSIAEEVVSLTFLEAWRRRDQVEPGGGSLRPWLLGIAVNVSRNTARASRRHEAAMSRLRPPPPVPDHAEEVAGRLDDAAQLRQVERALAGLGQAERELIALCVWSGLDYGTAARTLGIPVGTVRSRLSRARRKLRKLVPAEGNRPAGAGQLTDDHENPTRSSQGGTR
jgi:RNA polymerase sigma-70 factor, ECF subfamily